MLGTCLESFTQSLESRKLPASSLASRCHENICEWKILPSQTQLPIPMLMLMRLAATGLVGSQSTSDPARSNVICNLPQSELKVNDINLVNRELDLAIAIV